MYALIANETVFRRKNERTIKWINVEHPYVWSEGQNCEFIVLHQIDFEVLRERNQGFFVVVVEFPFCFFFFPCETEFWC